MVKIWEVDFTKTSGTSPMYYLDNIGTQHLTNISGSSVLPTQTSSLPGLSNRPGVIFPSADSTYTALDLTGKTNAHLCNAYTGTLQRSLEIWFYLPEALSAGSTALWDSGGNIWTEGGTGGYAEIKRNGTTLDIYASLGTTSVSLPGALASAGWKHIVITVNRVLNRGRAYYNTDYEGTISDMPTTSPVNARIGDNTASAESYFMLGKLATYNTELSIDEIRDLYNTFLVNKSTGDVPYQTISGTIYDEDRLPVSGHLLTLLYHTNQTIVNSGVTTSSGTYSITVPHAGNFTLISTPVTGSGGAAYNLIVTSGGSYTI